MFKITFVDVGTSRDELNEPLGIENLAGSLEAKFADFVDVGLISLDLSDIDDCLPSLIASDIVGISTAIGSLQAIETILNSITSGDGLEPLVLLGNTLSTYNAEYFVDKYPHVLCVKGEGEEAVTSIVDEFLSSRDLNIDDLKRAFVTKEVPNLVFRINDRIVETPRKLVDLNNLPRPSRKLLTDIIVSQGLVRIEASRGCFFGCTFCSVCDKYDDHIWRPFPIQRIVGELKSISDAGGKSPYFTDEDFLGGGYERAIELAQKIIEAKQIGLISRDLDFFFSTSVKTILKMGSKDQVGYLFSLLQTAGLREIFLGIESGSFSQLRRFGKGVTPDDNLNILNLLRIFGFSIDVGFIMFDPEVTIDELVENIQFIRRARLNHLDSRLTKPIRLMPRTVITKRLIRKGLTRMYYDNNELMHSFNFQDSMVQNIFDIFFTWEQVAAERVYALQGHMRGETSKTLKSNYKDALSKLRNLDIEYLEKCIARVSEKTAVNLNEISATLNDEFSPKRDLILESVKF